MAEENKVTPPPPPPPAQEAEPIQPMEVSTHSQKPESGHVYVVESLTEGGKEGK